MLSALSRTMRPQDYDEFTPELARVHATMALCGPLPYMHRMWEYELILRSIDTVFPGKKGLEVADFGCSDGLSPALLLREGHNVSLYDIWDPAYGDKRPDAENKARLASMAGDSFYHIQTKGLGQLTEEDKGIYDVALCISVIEHIQDENAALNDILDSVKERGLVVITMDFHPSGVDNLYYHWLRHRIYDANKMDSLRVRAAEKGFTLVNGSSDWSWNPSMVMVQNEYGFSSIVLQR